MDIFFLEARVPLTKTITPTEKEPYPNVKNFTSYKEAVFKPTDLYRVIKHHAAENRCLLKGKLNRTLRDESRAGSTTTDDTTSWICLDFDRFTTPDIDEQLTTMGLHDVTYVLQYSSSHGLAGTEGTISAHVFMLLDSEVPAPMLKAWLMGVNLTHFRDNLRLSRCKNTLSYPLDITTCQNDKLLYISPPQFVDVDDPLGGVSRVQLISRPLNTVPVSRLSERHMDALKVEVKTQLNALRRAEGLPASKSTTKLVGGSEVIVSPTTATVTGIKKSGDYVRLNINGGDSWAYWHPLSDFELIHDFKSSYSYETKKFLPGYYQDCRNERAAIQATPNEDGDLILAFRDLHTANYYNGIWNPAEKHLEFYKAKNETQLNHWMLSHGRVLGDFIPIWEILYNPREDWQVDEPNHRINNFKFSSFMRLQAEDHDPLEAFPDIMHVICHMLGEPDERTELVEHFLNWVACVFQRNRKPLTAWLCHGCEGTGKGFFANKIMAPLVGHSNFTSVTVDKIEDGFNGWLDSKLFVFIDEVDVKDFEHKGRVSARLRNYITEPTIAVRHMQQVTRDVPNYANFLFSSNRPQPVHIPESDRRYNVGNFQPQKLTPPDEAKVSQQLEAFAEFLINYKVDNLAVNTPLQTAERERIQRLSINSIKETINMIMEGDLGSLWMTRTDERLLRDSGVINPVTANAVAYNYLLEQLVEEAANPKHPDSGKLTRDELLIILKYNIGTIPESPNKFTSFLRHNGVETKRIRKNGQLCYGLETKWKLEKWLIEEVEARKPRMRRVK